MWHDISQPPVTHPFILPPSKTEEGVSNKDADPICAEVPEPHGFLWETGIIKEKSYEICPLNTIAKFFSQSLSVAQEFLLSFFQLPNEATVEVHGWSYEKTNTSVLVQVLNSLKKTTNYYLVESFLFLRK